MAQKTSQPFDEQLAAWFGLSAFLPQEYNAFQQIKPQEFNDLFGPGYDQSQLNPFRRFTQPYQPFDYLATDPFGRPGGPSQSEQDLLNNSYFGTTSPLDLQGPTTAAGNLGKFNASLGPGGSYWNDQIANMYGVLGGKVHMPGAEEFPGYMNMVSKEMPGGAMGKPTAPTAPTIPGAPSLPAFNFDTAGYARNAYNALIGGQPGLASALQASLHPQIALPTQNIFQQVAGQSGQGGLMDQYVKNAVSQSSKAFETELGKQQLALNSRFAGEGVFGSGANLSALSNLTSDATAQFGGQMGQMQLQAANQERDRIFKAAETQYGTEYARNLAQVQMQADQATKMQQTFASMAASTGSAQASAQAQAYGDQARYLSNIYQTQVGALEQTYGTQANIYGTQVGAYGTQQGQMLKAATDLYGIQTGAAGQQQALVMNAAQSAAKLMSENFGMSFDQAMKIAMTDQANKQAALDALQKQYYQPGANLLQVLQGYLGLPNVSKTSGGFDIGGALGGAGKLIGGLAPFLLA